MPKTDRQIDAEIRRRQRRAAYDAGRRGDDRERTARGRTDLYDAYDQGAAETAEIQRKAARAAGRAGLPRERINQTRPDMLQASDEGASDREPAEGSSARKPAGPGRAERAYGTSSAYLSRGSWRPTLTPPSRARDAGGLLAGMLLYTAAITYIRYGPAGWTGWLKAKFLNRPMQGLPKGKGGPPTTVEGGAT